VAKPRKVTLEISPKVFNPVYLPYLEDNTPTQIFFGGSSSGKSYFLAQRCVLDVAKGGRNYLITRKVADTVKRSVFNEVKKAITFFQLGAYFKINESDMIMTCQNGYQILFAGLSDAEKIKSITPAMGVITDIWEEEATEDDYDDHKQLDKRLRGATLPGIVKRHIKSFNPILQTHWIYSEFFGGWTDDSKELKQPRLSILKTTYKDNNFLTDDDRERLESEKDPYYRDVYLFGNWGILGGVIFKNWKVQDLTEIRKSFDRFNNGQDFGFAEDPAASVVTHYDRRNRRLYVLDEIYERGMLNDRLARELKPLIGNDDIVCDSADPKSIHELVVRGIRARPARKGKDSVRFGIQWLQQQEIIIDVKCVNAKREFSSYKWRENKDGDVMPEPEDRNNHIIDAIRYANEHEWMPYKEEEQKASLDPKAKYYNRPGLDYKPKKRWGAGAL
jgi:phage terminase large subunit